MRRRERGHLPLAIARDRRLPGDLAAAGNLKVGNDDCFRPLPRRAPEEAARFSFLLSIPAIFGGIVLKLPEVVAEAHMGRLGLLAVGFALAFVVGYASIAALLGIVRRGRFGLFGIYCIGVGVAALILLR